MLIATSNENTVELWDAHSGKLLRTLEGHTGPIFGVAFDPQGGMLVSASYDKTVKLWNVHSGKLLRTLEGHTSWVINVAFSYDGRLFASLGEAQDRKIRLWRRDTWEIAAIIPRPNAISLLPDGSWIERALAFHPTSPVLASSYSEVGDEGGTFVFGKSTSMCSCASRPKSPLLAQCITPRAKSCWWATTA